MALPPIDIPLVLEQLRPGLECGPGCFSGATYEQLVAGWRAAAPVPTRQEMEAKWAELVAARRRPRPMVDLLTAIQALTATERNKLLAWMAAAFLRDHPRAAEQLGINVPGDEPEPQ